MSIFQDQDDIDINDYKVELFWVWYPGAREALHKAKVFNGQNSAQPISYDMLLNARRFNGSIYREDNVQGDRNIDDYVFDNALFQLLEGDRIKEGIRDRNMTCGFIKANHS